MAVIMGLVFILLGVLGLMSWFPEFLLMAKGVGPFFLLCSGVLAFVVGISAITSRRNSEKQKP